MIITEIFENIIYIKNLQIIKLIKNFYQILINNKIKYKFL